MRWGTWSTCPPSLRRARPSPSSSRCIPAAASVGGGCTWRAWAGNSAPGVTPCKRTVAEVSEPPTPTAVYLARQHHREDRTVARYFGFQVYKGDQGTVDLYVDTDAAKAFRELAKHLNHARRYG